MEEEGQCLKEEWRKERKRKITDRSRMWKEKEEWRIAFEERKKNNEEKEKEQQK